MTWKFENEAVPVNVFPPRNLRKGPARSGNWVEVYQEQMDTTTPKTVKKKKMYSKELTIEEVYAVHGRVEHKYISKLKFNSKQFTKVSSTGWDGLEPVTADFSINYLNIGMLEPFSSKLEVLEMPFNNMQTIQIGSASNFSNLVYLDLSWNYLTDLSVPQLAKLETLEILNLCGNRFSSFPVQEDNFANIIELRLSSNRLTEKCISNLTKLDSLESLYLDQNKIKAIPILTTDSRGVAFTQLEFLELSDNPLTSETDILPLASCPQLQVLRICRTKLARNYKGDPPMIKKYLIDQMGIDVVRDEKSKSEKPKTEYKIGYKVDVSIPKIKMSTVDERITQYRAECALTGAPDRPAIEAPSDVHTRSVSNEEKQDDKIDSTFFLTQEVTDGAVNNEPEIHEDEDFGSLEILDRDIDLESSHIGSEVLCTDLMILNDISELKLTEDEENEYKRKIDQMPTQLAFDQLKKMLHATGNPSKSIVLEKNERRAVRNMLPEALESRRNRKITHVVNVDDALAGSSIKQRKIAAKLFNETRDTFHQLFADEIEAKI